MMNVNYERKGGLTYMIMCCFMKMHGSVQWGLFM